MSTIIDGEIYIPATIRKQINNLEVNRRYKQAGYDSVDGSGITRRQHDVLKLLARGYSNKQISNILFLSEHTVKSHVSSLLRALDSSNRTECVSIARKQGLIR